jgi:hypothetical protein
VDVLAHGVRFKGVSGSEHNSGRDGTYDGHTDNASGYARRSGRFS